MVGTQNGFTTGQSREMFARAKSGGTNIDGPDGTDYDNKEHFLKS